MLRRRHVRQLFVPYVFVHGGVSGRPRPELPWLGAAVPSDDARSALDLVERAIHVLEDHPDLNAGYGAVLNQAGEMELDAGIADGATGRIGGVANVKVRHPISLARRVLEETPHVLLTGAGAVEFGRRQEQLRDTTVEQRRRWQHALEAGTLGLRYFGDPARVDTVGAVALDDSGRLAAGSSTGGVFGKLPGRVGDAPIFGAGMYADDTVAVVGTGIGELFLGGLAALRVALRVSEGASPQEACELVITELADTRVTDVSEPSAGLLALDRRGRAGAAYRGASWPVEGPDGPVAAVRMS
jgi:beta-aspartyl-peptidase (threonine type)